MAWSAAARQGASRRAPRAASRSAKPASAAACAARSAGPPGVVLRAHGGVGRVGGGDERVGGLAGGAQRGVQVGLAVELGQQRLAVPSGAQVGRRRPGAGPASRCSVSSARCFPVSAMAWSRASSAAWSSPCLAAAAASSAVRARRSRAAALSLAASAWSETRSAATANPSPLEPGGEVGDADVGGAQPRTDRLGPLRGLAAAWRPRPPPARGSPARRAARTAPGDRASRRPGRAPRRPGWRRARRACRRCAPGAAGTRPRRAPGSSIFAVNQACSWRLLSARASARAPASSAARAYRSASAWAAGSRWPASAA